MADLAHAEKRGILHVLVARIDVRRESVDITLRPTTLTDI